MHYKFVSVGVIWGMIIVCYVYLTKYFGGHKVIHSLYCEECGLSSETNMMKIIISIYQRGTLKKISYVTKCHKYQNLVTLVLYFTK